jgi:hypothetical protein
MLTLLVIFMLNPQIVYAKKHSYRHFTVYPRSEYPAGYDKVLDHALELVKQSELYNTDMKPDIFLNDGNGKSVKFILKKVIGEAFAWGYHNNVILNGSPDSSFTWLELNGYKRHLARTIAHELIHCYQAKKLGLFKANPIANIPHWKWEGYAEYVCYKSAIKNENQVLYDAITKYETGKDKKDFAWSTVTIDEGESFAGKDYYRFWIMVKYLADIKRFSFEQVIKTDMTEEQVFQEMIKWYKDQSAITY